MPLPEHRIALIPDEPGVHHFWGWTTSPATPGFYLRCFTSDEPWRVDLEAPHGVRAFIPSPDIPVSLAQVIAYEVAINRADLERQFLESVLLPNGWLQLDHARGHLDIEVYGGTDLMFSRSIPALTSELPIEVLASLIWRDHVP